MILAIRKEGDPILRQPAEKVETFDMEFQGLVDSIIETMRANNGMGLAAPQVGVSKRLFVCELNIDPASESELQGFPLTVVVNPEIVKTSQTKVKMVEGCLSIPNRELLIERPKSVTLRGQDRYGKKIKIKTDGLYARTIQHETDHLNSTLMVDHMKESKVLFIGTGPFGLDALKMLIADPQYQIVAVITGEAKSKVRGREIDRNRILKIAKEAKTPIMQPENINDHKVIEELEKLKPDIGVMVDFGQIIKQAVIDIPKYGIINIHPSLLPRHRGATPIQQTILAGDKTAGVTLIKVNTGLDTGDIIAQMAVELPGSETTTILHDYLREIGATLLLDSLPYYFAGDLKPVPQGEDGTTYTGTINKEDGLVDTNTEAVAVERRIRAYDSWPKVYVMVKGKRIHIVAVHFEEDGSFIIDRVKPEGKAEMTYEDFKRGYHQELTFKQTSGRF